MAAGAVRPVVAQRGESSGADGSAADVLGDRTWRAGAATTAGLTLGRPGLWPIALAGLLARGGLFLFLAPLVTLPSPVGLANIVGPTAITPTGASPGAVELLAVATAVACVVVVIGVTIGATTDAVLATAIDTPAGTTVPAGAAERASLSITPRVIVRMVELRLLTLVPLLIVGALVARSIGEATYRQFVVPSDLAESLVWRVARETWVPILIITICWQVVEVIGGIAVRRVMIRGESNARAILGAVGQLVRRPVTSSAAFVLGLVGLAAAVVPALLAAGVAATPLRVQLAVGTSPLTVAVVVMLFVAVWIGGLILCGVAATWRALLWTAEVARLPR
jgi:hypothetical protein